MFCEFVVPKNVSASFVFETENAEILYKGQVENMNASSVVARMGDVLKNAVKRAELCCHPFPIEKGCTVLELLDKINKSVNSPSFFSDKLFVAGHHSKVDNSWEMMCPSFSPTLPYVFVGEPHEPGQYIYQITENGLLIRMPEPVSENANEPYLHRLTAAEIHAILLVLQEKGGNLIYE